MKRYGLIVILLVLFSLVMPSCSPEDSVYVNNDTPFGVRVVNPTPLTITGNVAVSAISGNTVVTLPNPLPVAINSTVEDGRISTMSKDYFVGVAEGDIASHTSWTKMGYHPAATAAQTTVWEVGTNYVFPVAAQGMEVRSSSTNDDGSPVGTGALTVKIWYLTNTFVEKTETVTLDGTTNVNTVNTDIYRINYFQIDTCGNGTVAAGNIDIRNKTDHTTIYSRIGAGYTRARSTVYTVPIAKTLYITDVTFSAAYTSAGKSERFIVQTTYNELETVLKGFFFPFMEIMLVDNVYSKVLTIPHKLITGADLKVSVIGEANAQCTVVMRGWLE
jgi:hypothetical protein